MAEYIGRYTVYRTRFSELGYVKQARGLWRYIDLSDDPTGEHCRVVGPQYNSRAELLGDLTRYAADSWGLH